VLEQAALSVAAPDHWHALATIWACQAGKHVYVEKPVSHNLVEGRRMVEAARKYDRVVQAGMQRRSAAHFASARELVRSGKLGKVPYVQTWVAGHRQSIGKKADAPAPAGVDYGLWLGPAPERPFDPNRFHYDWHWNWGYGPGEVGNNGTHALDMARFLLDLDAPLRVTSGGGKYFYDDDQQTPDTLVTSFDFAHANVTWEHRTWSPTNLEGDPASITAFGERGTLAFDRQGWHVRDGVAASDQYAEMDGPHFRNFLDCVKDGKRPNADIEEGHKSTRLCHLGNVALRVGRVLHFDAGTETARDGPAPLSPRRRERLPQRLPEAPRPRRRRPGLVRRSSRGPRSPTARPATTAPTPGGPSPRAISPFWPPAAAPLRTRVHCRPSSRRVLKYTPPART
jgi:predicted dehydrogenase